MYIFKSVILCHSIEIMPNKCVIKNCSSEHHDNQMTITLHRFPLNDTAILQQWLNRIPLENFQPKQHSRLCSLHFNDSDFYVESIDSNTTRKRRRTDELKRPFLKPDAIPSNFLSDMSSNRSGNALSSTRLQADNNNLKKLANEMFLQECVHDINDLHNRLEMENDKPSGFLLIKGDNDLLIGQVDISDAPFFERSIVINQSMEVRVYLRNSLISNSQYSHIVSDKISNVSEILNLMAFLKSQVSNSQLNNEVEDFIESFENLLSNIDDSDETSRTKFLLEQLKLSFCSKYSRRYSPELLIFAYLNYSASSSAYSYLRNQNLIILPSVKTLKKITKKVNDETSGLSTKDYLRLRLSKLNEYDKNVILVIDEIYVANKAELSGGKIHGVTVDGSLAGTALCFMIKSLSSKYRDVVGIYPVKSITAEAMYQLYEEVMDIIHCVGFYVRAILVDNSHVNRKFFVTCLCNGNLSSFVTSRWTNENMFLIFDPTHNMKNIYNNFQKRRIYECPAMPRHFSPLKADFADIEAVYEIESSKPLKIAHRLSQSVIKPKNIEKSSVKLSVAVFNESTINALRFYDFADTASVLELITKVWNVLNVKTLSKGLHKRDNFQDPVRSTLDWKLNFLEEFADFLARWQSSRSKGLSYETFIANIQTCRALAGFARFLLTHCGFNYVLLGKIQSDCLESRFGWIRQLSGANYFISIRQLMESNKKIKTISLLKFSQISLQEIDDVIMNQADLIDNDSTISLQEVAEDMTITMTMEPDQSDLIVIYYVSGACARSVFRTHKCESCKETLVKDKRAHEFNCEDTQEISQFLKNIDRGGLNEPCDHTFQLCIVAWKIFYEITSSFELRTKFLNSSNQRSLFCYLVSEAISNQFDMFIGNTHCTNGHDIVRSLSRSFFNCLAKNFVNNGIQSSDETRNGKLERKTKKLCSKTTN